MPASTNPTLRLIAKETCRKLRKNQTAAESALWAIVRDRKFHGLKFYRQYPLFVDWLNAEPFFVADVFCFEKDIVIEVDGKIHDYRADHDQLRTFIIKQMGIQVVRLRNEEIEDDLGGALRRLEDALLSPKGEPSRP
jgi:very-short-patch-repair endonuclease